MSQALYAIHSMTGFATRKTKWNDWELTLELRSVNNRFLDTAIRLPDWLRSMESEIRAIMIHRIRRGRIDATLTIKPLGEVASELSINHQALKSLLSRLQEIHDLRSIAITSPSSLELLKWPGIIIEAEIDRNKLNQVLIELVEGSLEDLVISRQNEGNAIAALIAQRCEQIKHEVNAAKARMPEVMQLLRERLSSKIKELSQEQDQDRLEQEILFYAHKLDVAEELDRLEVHLTEMEKTLRSSEPVGRRLDFLSQEMNREANTLGSKSQDADMTRCTINMKVLIEQIKEQVQNIE